MKKTMFGITFAVTILTVLSARLYHKTSEGLLLTIAITFGTIAYHLIMRLCVGHFINHLVDNRIDYRKNWFRLRKCEKRVYDKWNVKTWKDRLPTYDPSLFSLRNHSFDEIAQAMCQAEIVHEVIILFSFVPLFFSIPFGAFPVFLITSLLSALFDSLFVIVQRYNRPRIIRLACRKQINKK